MTDAQWDEILAANLTSCFCFCRAATRVMMGQRYGRIINMSSVSGLIGNAGQTNYSATKAGMIGFTRSLSKELAKRKITVNAVAPGFIESDMTKALGEAITDEVKKRISGEPIGASGRCRRMCFVPCQPSCELCYRPSAHRRRRDDGLRSK